MNDLQMQIIEKRIERTVEALKKNNMDAVFVQTKEQALRKIKSCLLEGDTVGSGGSETLNEIGIIDYLNDHLREYNFLSTARRGDDLFSPQEKYQMQRQSLLSDMYLSGANAITENGEIFNIDGNSNRVAALAFGPKSVIIVVGYNKIVKDVDAAIERVKRDAAPANAIRLGYDTPCAKTGVCQDCKSPQRVCCTYMLQRFQRNKNRIKVIIVGEELGL
ncbi:MAG: lactate utilization protein [Oscillospiraceae bacterium]